MSIRWITPTLGTAPATELLDIPDVAVLDVRDLVDKAGNRSDVVKRKIDEGVDLLVRGRRVVVCCDYGISRSNAIAAGILSAYENIGFTDAVRKIQDTTGEKEIKLEPLMAVRDALGVTTRFIASDRKKILITGGSGFIGKSLALKLSKSYDLLTPTRIEVNLAMGSTQLLLLVEDSLPDYVIHLANPRVYTSTVALGQTLTMLRNVIDVCLSKDIPLAYLSGWEVYSGYEGTIIASESLPPFPKGPYGETKYLAEVLITHHRKNSGLKGALVRSGPIYGPGAGRPKFIFNFYDKAKSGKTITTHKYLTGFPALDLIYIDDLTCAIEKIIENSIDGDIHIGTGTLTGTHEIAAYIRDALGSTSEIQHALIKSGVASIAMNAAKAQSLLSWEPKVTLREGILKTLGINCKR